jgi:hypothetical protein
MQTTAATTHDRVSEVAVERDDDQVAVVGVVCKDNVSLVGEAEIAAAEDSVSTAVEQLGDRLDHVLVDQER